MLSEGAYASVGRAKVGCAQPAMQLINSMTGVQSRVSSGEGALALFLVKCKLVLPGILKVVTRVADNEACPVPTMRSPVSCSCSTCAAVSTAGPITL